MISSNFNEEYNLKRFKFYRFNVSSNNSSSILDYEVFGSLLTV